MTTQIVIKKRYDISRESILPSKKEINNYLNSDTLNKPVPIPNSVCSHKKDSQTSAGSPPNEFMLMLAKRMDTYFSSE